MQRRRRQQQRPITIAFCFKFFQMAFNGCLMCAHSARTAPITAYSARVAKVISIERSDDSVSSRARSPGSLAFITNFSTNETDIFIRFTFSIPMVDSAGRFVRFEIAAIYPHQCIAACVPSMKIVAVNCMRNTHRVYRARARSLASFNCSISMLSPHLPHSHRPRPLPGRPHARRTTQ